MAICLRSVSSSARSVCVFGLVIFFGLRNLPVHRSMREISELIWQTCKTYLLKQGQFLVMLWVFIAIVIGVYFGSCRSRRPAARP